LNDDLAHEALRSLAACGELRAGAGQGAMAFERHLGGYRVRRKVDGMRHYFGFLKDEARQMDAAVADEAIDTGAPTLRELGQAVAGSA